MRVRIPPPPLPLNPVGGESVVNVGPLLPCDVETGGQLRCSCGEPATPTATDWWLCDAGHEFRGPRHDVEDLRRTPQAWPVPLRLGFYRIETRLPVAGSWIALELVPAPLVWGRRWAASKARRIVAAEAWAAWSRTS